MAKRSHAKGSISYKFVAVPKLILASPEWQRLSFRGRSLALDLMNQYTGRNNGRLCPGMAVMSRSGWLSKDVLIKAKRELLACSFAIQTRMGHPPRTPEWVGFTWWQLDYQESMDIAPTGWPYMNFMTIEQVLIDPNEGRQKPNGKTHSVVRSTDRWKPKTAFIGPQHGPMEVQK